MILPETEQITSPFECFRCHGTGYLLIDHERLTCRNCEGRGIITNRAMPHVQELRRKRKEIDDRLNNIRVFIKSTDNEIDKLKLYKKRLFADRKELLKKRAELT